MSGRPSEVIASLAADRTLDRVTDLVVQVHSIDPPHPFILRSIELMAEEGGAWLGCSAARWPAPPTRVGCRRLIARRGRRARHRGGSRHDSTAAPMSSIC